MSTPLRQDGARQPSRRRSRASLRPQPRNRPTPETWDLRDLLADPEKGYATLTKEIDARARRFEELREILKPDLSLEQFMDALGQAESIARLMQRLGAYAYLWFSENTKHQAARSFKARVEELQA